MVLMCWPTSASMLGSSSATNTTGVASVVISEGPSVQLLGGQALEYGLREQVTRYRDPRSGGKHCSTFRGQIAISTDPRGAPVRGPPFVAAPKFAVARFVRQPLVRALASVGRSSVRPARWRTR